MPHFTPADTATVDASPVLIDAQAAVDAARHDADAVRSEWRGHVQLTASGGALGVTPGPDVPRQRRRAVSRRLHAPVV